MAKIIAFSGVDGSGKTTIAEKIIKKLQKKRIKTKYHHELDFYVLKGVYSFLRNNIWGKKKGEKIRSHFLSKANKNESWISTFYYLSIFFDNIVTYIYFKLIPGIVLSDRWIYDYIPGFKVRRYNNKLVIWLFSNFPKPDMYITYNVAPEIALKRKRYDPSHKNHGLDFYENLSKEIIKFNRKRGFAKIIDTDRPLDEIVDQTMRIIMIKIRYDQK